MTSICTLTLKIAQFREDILTTNGHQLTRIDPSDSRFLFDRLWLRLRDTQCEAAVACTLQYKGR
jgi:hypothetical protein